MYVNVYVCIWLSKIGKSEKKDEIYWNQKHEECIPNGDGFEIQSSTAHINIIW